MWSDCLLPTAKTLTFAASNRCVSAAPIPDPAPVTIAQPLHPMLPTRLEQRSGVHKPSRSPRLQTSSVTAVS